jgi:IclR family acetate operon transcriptional repressor
MSTDGAFKISAIDRICDILDLLQSDPRGLSSAQVAEGAEMSASSALRYLTALEARRYVERNEHGDYEIGMAFVPFVSRQLEQLTRRARPWLERLRDAFEETVNLAMLDRHGVTYLDIVESPRSVQWAARPGDRDGIHATALGKAVAARLPTNRVKQILAAEGMPRRTPATITDVHEYLDELAEVRQRGWAFDNGENEPDARCVAVPLTGSHLPLALSLSAPASRLPFERAAEIAAVLTDVAARVTEDHGRQGRPPGSPRPH